MVRTLKTIFNADDFGISPGVNRAIVQAHTQGCLNSTSLMITLKYAPQAIELARTLPDLHIGLHANLTNEQAVLPHAEIPLLTDENGKFCHGFVDLALLSVLHPIELKRQVKAEIKAQLDKALAAGVKLEHLDSHRHVHMIPLLFKAFMELQQEYGLGRLRFVNERFWRTVRATSVGEGLKDGGLIKNWVLTACAVANRVLWGFRSDTYFYSMVHTCKLSRDKVKNVAVPQEYAAVELGIHPGMPEVDKDYLPDVFDDNILRNWRAKELETLMDKDLAKEFR
jgi:predicted glycoside hydrolase/deacetylase ChbG (UPF0249 family)